MEHLHVALFDGLGVNLYRLDLFGAAHLDGDDAASGRGVNHHLLHLFLHLLLHLLGLLHHLLDVHAAGKFHLFTSSDSSENF